MENTLIQLSNEEFEIMDILKQHNYSLHPSLEAEIEKKYQAIHDNYTNTDNVEALKRAIFIQWYSAVEPVNLTGIGKLNHASEIKNIEKVNALKISNKIDLEFTKMIQHYYNIGDWYFDQFKNMHDFEFLVNSQTESKDPIMLKDRGQMGTYWSSLSSPNR